MYVFAEPVTNEQMAEIQTTRNQEIQDFEKSVLGLEKEMVERDENSWDDVQAIVDDAVHKDEAEEDELDDSLTAPTQEEWVDQYKEEAQDDEVPDELSAEAIEDEVEIEEAEEAEGQSENGEHGGSSVEVEAEEDDSVYPGKNLVGLEPGERELLDTGSGTSFVDGLNPIEFDEEVSSMEPSMEDSEMDEVPEADTAESSPLNAVTEEQVQANPDQSDAPNPAADSVLTALRAKLYGVGDVYGKTDVSPAARNEEESSAKGLDEESTHDADQQSDQIELLEESELATPSTEPITVEDAALEEALLSDLDHEVFDEGHSSGEHLLSAGAEEELLLGQETEGTESTTDLDDTQTPQGAEPQAKIFQPEQSSELPGITLSEALKQKPSPNPPSLTSTSSQFSEKLSNTPEIIGMIVAMRNKVNGQYVKRPTNFNASKKWVVEYRIQEIASQERAQKLYDMCKKRRKKALDPNRFDGDDNKYMRTFFQSLRTLSDNGKKWRARREREERENEDVVLGKDEE